jgi:adenylosuccinate lyase
LDRIVRPENFVGRAPEQTEEFILEIVEPVLKKYQNVADEKTEINV